MNEKATNLTPDTPANAYRDGDEYKFTTQFYIAEGAAGLLSYVANKATFDEVSIRALASATFSIATAVSEMNEIFHNLLNHNLALHIKKNKENTIATNAININNARPIGNDWGDIEGEFNHQHLIAEGAAGLLFKASENPQGSMNNPVINSAAYSMQSAINDMNKMFDAMLHLNIDEHKEAEKIIEEMRTVETNRQNGIMELVAEFDDDHPQLRLDSIDAIKDGTTLKAFQEHVLRAISLKNASLEHNVQ